VQLSDIADAPGKWPVTLIASCPARGRRPHDIIAHLRAIGYDAAVAIELHNPACGGCRRGSSARYR